MQHSSPSHSSSSQSTIEPLATVLKRKHKFRRSCDSCTVAKLRCSQTKPACVLCVQKGRANQCTYSIALPPGRQKKHSNLRFCHAQEAPAFYNSSWSDHGDFLSPGFRGNHGDVGNGAVTILGNRIPPLRDVGFNSAGSNSRIGSSETASTSLTAGLDLDLLLDLDHNPFESAPFHLETGSTITEQIEENNQGQETDTVQSNLQQGTAPSLPPISDATTSEISQSTSLWPSDWDFDMIDTWPDAISTQARSTPNEQSPRSSTSVSSSSSESEGTMRDGSLALLSMLGWTSRNESSPTKPAIMHIDNIFAAEKSWLAAKAASPGCSKAQSEQSPHVQLTDVTFVDSLVERLDFCFRRSQDAAAQLPRVEIGGFVLGEGVSRRCVKLVAKRWLLRQIEAAQRTMDAHRGSRHSLSEAICVGARSGSRKAQALFGIIDLEENGPVYV